MDSSTAHYLTISASCLSYLGCIFVITTYCLYREKMHKIPAFRMVLQIAIADLYYVTVGLVNILFSPSASSDQCEVLGFFAEHAALVASTWAFLFAFSMYAIFKQTIKSSQELKKYYARFLVLAWVVPIIFALVPIFLHGYGHSTLYCWIDDTINTELYYSLILGILYIPMGIEMALVLFYYTKIYQSFKDSSDNSEGKILTYELMFYPLGIILNFVVSGLDRFVNIGCGFDIVWIMYLQVFIKQAQGFINALVYGYSSKVRSIIRQEHEKRKKLKEEPYYTAKGGFFDYRKTKNLNSSTLTSDSENSSSVRSLLNNDML